MNWAKNERVRAVFVAEVKIPENEPFRQNHDFRHFGGNFDFYGTGPILKLMSDPDCRNFQLILTSYSMCEVGT